MASSDSDRPPVLAHQRFLEDKEAFVGLKLAQRFRRIHDINLWGAAASASGLGSEMERLPCCVLNCHGFSKGSG